MLSKHLTAFNINNVHTYWKKDIIVGNSMGDKHFTTLNSEKLAATLVEVHFIQKLCSVRNQWVSLCYMGQKCPIWKVFAAVFVVIDSLSCLVCFYAIMANDHSRKLL